MHLRKLRESKNFPFFLFFFLLLIPFLAYFARPDFVGMDSYGYLLMVCQNNTIAGVIGLPFYIFSLLPCNFLVLKAVLFALAFVSGCFIIKMAILFSPKNGWKAAYLVFLSSVPVLEFVKLENDQFAFPLLFASVYFFFKGIKTGKRTPCIYCLILLIVAELIWKGAFFYLIGYALYIWPIWILLLPPMLIVPEWVGMINKDFHIKSLIRLITYDYGIMENMPFKFHVHFLLNFGILGVVLDPLLMPMGLFLFILGVGSAKFWILSLPFLAVGMVLLLEKANYPLLEQIAVIASALLILGLVQSVWLNPPNEEHWEAIDYALSIDKNVNNDWGMGYWVLWKGGTTESFMGSVRQQEFSAGEIVISDQNLDCAILEDFERVKVYRC